MILGGLNLQSSVHPGLLIERFIAQTSFIFSVVFSCNIENLLISQVIFSVREREKNFHFWFFALNQFLFLNEHFFAVQKRFCSFYESNFQLSMNTCDFAGFRNVL